MLKTNVQAYRIHLGNRIPAIIDAWLQRTGSLYAYFGIVACVLGPGHRILKIYIYPHGA
jgi:hypothetical protein